ncbi:arginine--tRNA ligase [Engelhardtia mirabilis]|uniref:Arginine--tRNA ligase n=1 Tax=Engelhardtia mirabilis TaxID=2528011 RepID=A0A518BFJ6_9BACT|nr:Arginine--tRNA ligase [Planctomycetes bacterium Pla133]QDV00068.1 Arginine--tRNA ligase [Planctomycetes bacterium Pla86]
MQHFRTAVLDALERVLIDVEGAPDRAALAQALSKPPKPEMGDLAFPCFLLAKALKTAPPKIAAELAEKVEPRGLIAGAKPFGPYLNFFADAGAVLAELVVGLEDGSFEQSLRTEAPQRVMVEFSQPNTHKVFHVGHLRNVSVGDALQRVFRARGHDVIAANYYGDFGIDVAKCLWQLEHGDVGEAPGEGQRGSWLGQIYAQAGAHLTALEEAGDEAGLARVKGEMRGILDAIKAGEEPYTSRYRETRQWCLDEFGTVYTWLDVNFDTDFFESDLEEPGHAIVDEYLAKGVFEPSQGAIVCMLDDYKLGPALVRKSDGTSLYLTWDLVLARRKFDEFGVERSLYVVGAEQTYHFRQLFATLERMGYERAKDCTHVAYELVMLPEGKMSSRKGKVVTFAEVRDDIVEAIGERMRTDERNDRSDWSDEKWRETVDRIAVACLRYGMLSVSNNTRVIFDAAEWTNLEGETGAYLLYSLARISGIFRKGGRTAPAELAAAARGAADFGGEPERALLNHLLAYADVLEQVERTTDPAALSAWIYGGARAFSRFYHDCPVLTADEPLRSARLALSLVTERILGHGLRTLGIEPVEAM